MKFFVCFALFAIVASAVASPTSGTSASISGSTAGGSVAHVNQESEVEGVAGQGYGDLTRLRKSAYGASAGASSGGYGAASVPSPPCPKNYLFSCQPNLAPVPCAAASAGYGSAGAYSANVASYIAPHYGVPQPQQQLYNAGYLPQAYGYQY